MVAWTLTEAQAHLYSVAWCYIDIAKYMNKQRIF